MYKANHMISVSNLAQVMDIFASSYVFIDNFTKFFIKSTVFTQLILLANV